MGLLRPPRSRWLLGLVMLLLTVGCVVDPDDYPYGDDMAELQSTQNERDMPLATDMGRGSPEGNLDLAMEDPDRGSLPPDEEMPWEAMPGERPDCKKGDCECEGASCRCSGEHCHVDCKQDCTITCLASEHCKLRCEDGARCLLRCADDDNCEMDKCDHETCEIDSDDQDGKMMRCGDKKACDD